MHSYLLHNGEIRGTSEPLVSPGQVGFMNGWGIFSTLRVKAGVLFAFRRHYERMRRDAQRMHVPFDLTADELEHQLLKLVEANKAENATLRVAIVRNHGGLFEGPGISRAADIVAFTADLNTWGAGAKLTYVPQGRHGANTFAGAKITSWAQNLTWYEEAHQRGFDEVILLNEHGEVSECTSANIFIIHRKEVWTPSLLTSGCLPGVTRAVLLEEVQVEGLTVKEQDFLPGELEAADQVFITSTTRDLMPVLSVDGRPLRQNAAVLNRLREAFLAHQDAYVAEHSPEVAPR